MKVFVSSVVTGFEPFRAAAKRAIETVDALPVMCETFGARPYSSERACLTEIEASGVFVLVLGERFGFEPTPGVSVTQQEFRHACERGIPVLVFVRDAPMEPAQIAFRQEVEAFHGGFSRELFSSPDELKDKIVQTLLRLERSRNAMPQAEFEARLAKVLPDSASQYQPSYDPVFSFAFLPQPGQDLDLRHLEAGRDDTFSLLCRVGLAALQHGYEPIDEVDHTGLKTRQGTLRQFDDGLLLLETKASIESPAHVFASSHVPPSHIRQVGLACFALINANGGWCRIGLRGMENVLMAELPNEASRSFSSPSHRDFDAAQSGLLIPCTEPAYKGWLDKAVAKLERRFGPRP